MFQQSAKPVDLIVIEATRIEGNPVDAGAVLRNVPPDLAMELAAAGKVRVATEELIAEYVERAKAAKKLAASEASKAGDAQSAADGRLAATVAAAVAAALQAAGVLPAAKAVPEAKAEAKAP